MNAFLIESTISLWVLYIAYYLFLSSDSTHHFNRIILLFSIVFSLLLPFITIEIIEEIQVSKNLFVPNQTFQNTIFIEEKNQLF